MLGLAGLVGSGRTELLRLIYGADRKDSGDVLLTRDSDRRRAEDRLKSSPVQAVARGHRLRHREDRKSQGLLLPQSIRVNLRRWPTSARGLAPQRLAAGRDVENAETSSGCATCCDVRSDSIEQPVDQLSGGNQQKVVFARWLHRDCDVLLLDEPTRGVDIGARADIYARRWTSSPRPARRC